ncbi:DNA replication protein [Pseudomonadota bacterium]
MSQIPFDFDHRPALGGEDFLVAASNADAVAWVERWQTWAHTVLVVTGPEGAGKTHLAHVFQNVSGAEVLTPEALARDGADQALADHKALVLEDAEGFLDFGLEEELLHLYNLAREGDVKLLMTAVNPPARWVIGLKDLSSRLNTAQLAEIKTPDDALLTALVVKQFNDRQLSVDQDVLAYMLSRMDRSFAGVRDLVQAIDEAALAEKRAITKPLVRRVLEDLGAQDET